MSATGVSLEVLRELRAICGDEHVLEPDQKRPSMFARPGSADEVAAVLRLANTTEFTVAPFGGQGDADWPSEASDVVLQTCRLTEVEHYDPADLTVGIGAGTTVAQLNTLVGPGKLIFGCDPPLPERATVGGVLAAAKHGPLRHGYGGVRDYCIGIRFVTGDGRKAKAGGHVVKNVAGYDMMKLLIGSYGTLAVITSASFKLFPAPRQTRTFLAAFSTWQEALKFRDQVIRSPLSPMCLELVSPRARKLMRPEMSDEAWIICVRAAGTDAVLARYRKELGAAVIRELDGDAEAAMWRALEDFPITDKLRQGLLPHLLCLGHRSFSLFAPPAECSSIFRALEDFSKLEVADAACIGRVGLGHILVAFDTVDTKANDSKLMELLQNCLPSYVQVSANWKSLPNLPSMRAVKRALDPNNALRGRELF